MVPVVIRGSRHMLPAAQVLPGPGRIEIIIKAPLFPGPETMVADLLEDARRSILADLDEPDLAARGK